jgi:hypothetical protein
LAAPDYWQLRGGTEREYGFYRSLFERGLRENVNFTVEYPQSSEDWVRFDVRGRLYAVAVNEDAQRAQDWIRGRGEVSYTPVGDLDAL